MTRTRTSRTAKPGGVLHSSAKRLTWKVVSALQSHLKLTKQNKRQSEKARNRMTSTRKLQTSHMTLMTSQSHSAAHLHIATKLRQYSAFSSSKLFL